MLSHNDLRDRLHYSPETGQFLWLTGRLAGDWAGTINDGYVIISVDGVKHRAHRLAWFWVTGEWPAETVDHINRNRADNRWSNLRLATVSQQNRNRPPRAANKAKLKGVMAHKNGRFYARVSLNGKREYSGGFATAEEAHAAFMARSAQLFGEFAHAA